MATGLGATLERLPFLFGIESGIGRAVALLDGERAEPANACRSEGFAADHRLQRPPMRRPAASRSPIARMISTLRRVSARPAPAADGRASRNPLTVWSPRASPAASRTPGLQRSDLRHTPCTAGSSSGRPDRPGGMYPLRVGVTMSLHKLTAGSGYDYLTRQVAALDATEKGHTGLASYYTERGETPGAWIGSGMDGIDGLTIGDPVTAEQMRALFGCGLHPLAELRQQQLEGDDGLPRGPHSRWADRAFRHRHPQAANDGAGRLHPGSGHAGADRYVTPRRSLPGVGQPGAVGRRPSGDRRRLDRRRHRRRDRPLRTSASKGGSVALGA